MQQYTWGDYVWGLPNGNQLEGYQRSYDGGWVEIELLNELPLPQQTGRALDTITLSGRWFGIEARAAEDKLAASRDERKPRTLVRGDGVSLGQWFLKSFDVKGSAMIHDGLCMACDVTITLKEFPRRV